MGQSKIEINVLSILDELLQISLDDLSLEGLLNQCLNIITSSPLLTLSEKGVIFLADNDKGLLNLVAHSNLDQPLQKICKSIPIGKCICGRAASTKELLFKGGMDGDHENSFPDMKPHGHYAIPILYRNTLLGVLSLYIDEGTKKEAHHVQFLKLVASVLSAIIVRKKSDLESQRMKEVLTESEKLAAIGTLAAGIGHELNNPLQLVQGFANRIGNGLKKEGEVDREKLLDYLSMVEENCLRMREIIKQIKAFSRKSDSDFTRLSINEVICKSFLFISEALKVGQVVLTSNLDLTNPEVMGNANRLQQVFVNIITNSRDSIIESGRKWGEILVLTKVLTKEKQVEVSFADNGTGIKEADLESIFNPFFTTKEVGKGTGLGLSISHGIITDHNGIITCKSSHEQGAEFIIRLPLAEEKATVDEVKK